MPFKLNKRFRSNMIYIFMLQYKNRLRVIGFPLNLWVGSSVGLENRDSNLYRLLLSCFSSKKLLKMERKTNAS